MVGKPVIRIKMVWVFVFYICAKFFTHKLLEMPTLKSALAALLFCALYQHVSAQQADSTRVASTFSGNVGLTTNGFSIVPTFSLNAPAAVMQLSWRKKKFSFDPDFRFTLDAKKGSMLFWFRYHAIEKKRFHLRVGIHPAYNLALRTITENGIASDVTQARRFIAEELAPSFRILPNWSVGMYYLQGNGLQKDGPQVTHFVTLNTSISNLKLGGGFQFQFNPAFYYLYLDGQDGWYFTETATISRKNWPVMLQSSINKVLKTGITGSKDFLWNVSLSYFFNRKYLAEKI